MAGNLVMRQRLWQEIKANQREVADHIREIRIHERGIARHIGAIRTRERAIVKRANRLGKI